MATFIGKMMVKHQIWSTIWTNPKDEGSLKIWVGWWCRICVMIPTFFRFSKLTHHFGKGLKPPTSEWCKSKMNKNAAGDPAQRTRTCAEQQQDFSSQCEPKNQKPFPILHSWLSRNGSFQNSKPLGSSIGFIQSTIASNIALPNCFAKRGATSKLEVATSRGVFVRSQCQNTRRHVAREAIKRSWGIHRSHVVTESSLKEKNGDCPYGFGPENVGLIFPMK